MENIANENVIATRLDRCILDPTHLKQIRDAVERTHKIVTDGTELIALHLTKRLQSGMQLPLVNAAWVKSVFMEVSSGNGKRTRTDDDLAKTRVRFMSSLVATSRQSLDQVLMAEAIAFTASFNTNLHRHLRKRIYKFVRLHFADKRRDRPLDEYKKHKQTLMFIASDLCKPSGVPFESDAAYHDWVTRWRTELELSRLPDWDMSENVKMHQTDMLQASWKINKAFEAAEEATFSICPIRRHFVPRFVHFDTKAIATVLSTGLTDHQKHVNRLAEAKRKERAKRKADRERIGVPVRDRLQLTPHALTEWNTVAITDEYTAAVCVVQRLWRGFFTRDVIATCTVVGSRTLNHKAAVRLQQNMRGWLVRHRVIRKAFQTKMASQLQASKEIQLSSILSWNGKDAGGKKIKVAKDKMFAGSLRLFMKRIGKAPAKKTNAPMRMTRAGCLVMGCTRSISSSMNLDCFSRHKLSARTRENASYSYASTSTSHQTVSMAKFRVHATLQRNDAQKPLSAATTSSCARKCRKLWHREFATLPRTIRDLQHLRHCKSTLPVVEVGWVTRTTSLCAQSFVSALGGGFHSARKASLTLSDASKACRVKTRQ